MYIYESLILSISDDILFFYQTANLCCYSKPAAIIVKWITGDIFIIHQTHDHIALDILYVIYIKIVMTVLWFQLYWKIKGQEGEIIGTYFQSY